MTDFKDFKPLSAEAVVAANPDVILLFDSGLQSVGGVDGFAENPRRQQHQRREKVKRSFRWMDSSSPVSD